MPVRPRRRVPWRLVVLGAVVLVGLWGVLVVRALLQVRADTQSGVDRLEQAGDVITPSGLVEGEGLDLLRSAGTDFARARDRVRSPVVAPLRVLPVIGRQVRAVDSMTGAAADVVDIGVRAADSARQQLEGTRATGPERIALARDLAGIAADASVELEGVGLGPGRALLAPLRDAHERFGDELGRLTDTVDRVSAASSAFADFLTGPSRYLVLAANNAEMRVGSGTFLSVGTMTVADGRFEISEMRPTEEYELLGDAPPLSGEFADRWGWLRPNREWRNLGASPRFASQAELAARMWRTATGERVDGVLALDPVALRALLLATGPLTVDGAEVSADTVVDAILRAQYLGLDGYPEQQARRDRLSAIARAALQRLDAGDWETVTLFDALRGAAEGRHVLLWSGDGRIEQGWTAAGVGGTVGDDALVLGLHNRGGNKLDYYLETDAALHRSPIQDGNTEVTVDLTLRNRTPEGLPRYIVGPYPRAAGARAGLYQGLLVAYVPAAARDVYLEVDGERVTDHVVAGPEGGSRVVAAYVEVARGESRRAAVHFDLPAGVTSLDIRPSARVPAIRWTDGDAEWSDGAPHRVEW